MSDSRWPDGLRQWRHPRAFRIAPPSIPEKWADALWASLQDGPASAEQPAPEPPAVAQSENAAAAGTLRSSAVAELATGLWRLRRRLDATPAATGAGAGAGAAGARSGDTRRLQRQLDSLWSTLGAAGVEVQDHDRIPYDSGLDLQVLEFQRTTGLTGETVLETLRPSVYLHGQRVQTGEVVVGTPVEEPSSGPEER
ncbi:hypothetical protein CcI49_05775 [Frankia sp. CcI49]|uniref:hypothetical protein n=1 Tax=Frankia sp. CcI49 TaxID=1745382 RepID=UPI0009782300|nr:hypothetical protein [Frankia sp. CcI49]ONH61696.1 hypothetical protein CcI49_05775 [Frankia sp. CcI49]